MSCDIAQLGMAGLLHFSAIVDERQQAGHTLGTALCGLRDTHRSNDHSLYQSKWACRSRVFRTAARSGCARRAMEESLMIKCRHVHSDICMYVMLSYAVMRLFASHSAYMCTCTTVQFYVQAQV